jgi:hypothetical protein
MYNQHFKYENETGADLIFIGENTVYLIIYNMIILLQHTFLLYLKETFYCMSCVDFREGFNVILFPEDQAVLML